MQLPLEILETLAHSNYLSAAPRQTDPAVLYDLLKVRKLVDEAADLTVRAQNGTASSALSSDNGSPGAALGLNTRGAGGNARLSPERKQRMRELAISKLSLAYSLDEVAASVATMQSASTLESVAGLVLQRAPNNTDAKYVHFFHEKIPSRMMAEYTPLTPLNEIIALEPGHAAPYRTRALTRIFKDDFLGAAQDLTEALALCKMEQQKHRAGKNQLISLKPAREEAEKRKIWTRDWMQENRVLDEDQPKGIEMQLLFQRGNQYLTLACQLLRRALECFKKAQLEAQSADSSARDIPDDSSQSSSVSHISSYHKGLELREAIRKYAKRALRDYTAFFSHLDYAHASDQSAYSNLFGREDLNQNQECHLGYQNRVKERGESSPQLESHSQALIRRPSPASSAEDRAFQNPHWPPEPALMVHDMSKMLSSSPPTDLPPFPQISVASKQEAALSQHQEMITYHPLMPETLHSFLLTHCLLQTPPTTLHRIANNAARVARLADGYPFFLSARSPARADWAEILRKAHNWIGLAGTWDQLCKMPPHLGQEKKSSQPPPGGQLMPSQNGQPTKRETTAEEQNRIHKEAVMEALSDERVVDDDSFQKAVKARENRAWREMEAESNPDGDGANGNSLPVANGVSGTKLDEPLERGKKASVAKDEEYLIGTERAEAIAKWIVEAPSAAEGASGRPRKAKKSKRKLAGQNLDGSNEEGQHDAVTNGIGDVTLE